jgi:AAA family ATP:ADP antiporter
MLRRIADMRRGNGRPALAFAVLLLVVGSYTLVKAVRDAVFLSRFSVTELSLVSIALAALSGVIVSVYLRTTSGVARNRLVVGTQLVVAVSLFAIAAGLAEGGAAGWLPWVLYGWSSVFGVFVVAQFWLLAGDLFDAREARRVFGPIGWGGVAGGLAGGAAARALATRVGAPGLLSIAAAMLLVAAIATTALWNRRRIEIRAVARSAPPARPSGWALLARPSYLRLLAGGVILATIVTTLLDWQLKTVAKHALHSRTDDLAAFFGAVHASMSAGALVLQALVTPWLFRRYGIGVGRAVLPAVLVLGFATVSAHALLPLSLLALLTGARLLEGSARFAINQPAAELSWLPLPASERDVGKPLVDTVGDRIGTALAGVVWIGFAALSLDRPETVHWIGLAGVALAAAWLALLQRTQRAYVDQMRSALAQRSVDLDSLRRSLGDAATRQTIVDSLQSGDERRLRFALYLLESWELALPDLGVALRHARPAVRVQALRLLADKRNVEQRALAAPNLVDDDVEVCEAAVAYLRATAPVTADPVVDGLTGGGPRVRLLRWLITAPEADVAEARAADAAASIASAAADARPALIRLLGAGRGDAAARVLAPLLDDADDRIAEAAVSAAGRAGAVSLVPLLATKLAERRWRAAVVSALTDIGRDALPPLVPLLRSVEAAPEVRRAVVRLAAATGDAEIAADIAVLLDDETADIAREALRALARIRARTPIAVDARKVRARLIDESLGLARELLFLDRGAWPQARDGDGEFLERSVRDAVNGRVERIFRLLSLIHEPTDVQSAYRGLRSALQSTRSSSVEFLDNLLDAEVKRVLLISLDDADRDRFAAIAREAVGLSRQPRERALAQMIAGSDPWLRQVARWATRSREETSMGLSLVEKALELGTVDVLGRVSSEDLAYIAQIAEEVALAPGAAIYAYGDAPDALYVILSGAVRLHQEKDEIGVLGAGEAFGSWALFDDAPRVASAIADGPTTVLKVDRDEFLELLGDRMAITRAIFKAMVERIRSLAELAQQR